MKERLHRAMVHAVAGCCLLTVTLSLRAQPIQINKDNKTIAISTSDDASAVADTAVIDVGFLVYGAEQGSTYEQGSQTSNEIFKALTDAGVPKDAIESTAQGLSLLAPEGDENKSRYAQGMRFQFSQTWHVTAAATQAAKVLQLAIASGANNSGNIDWQLRRDNALQAEAAGKALTHAREIASSMAKGLGAKLGSLIYASNQTPQRIYGLNSEASEISASALSAPTAMPKARTLAIQPQRITKSATVYAVFALK